MPNYHVEVHGQDRTIEHYILLFCKNNEVAIQRVRDYYAERGKYDAVGLWELEADRVKFPYLIFRIVELADDPVIYISGEYRSQFPV